MLHRGSYRILAAGDDHLVFARFNDRQALVLVLNRAREDTTYIMDTTALGAGTADVVAPVPVDSAGDSGSVTLSGTRLSVTTPARRSLLLRCETPD